MSSPSKHIFPSELVAFDDFTGTHPIKVDLVYAQPLHPDNMFKTSIYHPDAKLWGHRDLVKIVLTASRLCFDKTGWIFEIKDCLRPFEAQALMCETEIVKANPQWLKEPRLLSPPGAGGHPRGMAVDIILVDENGEEINMGTHFDHLTEDHTNNPAARNYTNFSDDETCNRRILNNRRILKESMMQAATKAGRELLPYPEEWWDFRFPPAYSDLFDPLRDADLPPEMQMMARAKPSASVSTATCGKNR
ncbi:MAG: D-Ala-D-Ala dipeptidase [Alphaproteobacteria bacterium]|nr:D-Ala-D-Ala dipeptidase [Alphaproteobacteria bacterium]